MLYKYADVDNDHADVDNDHSDVNVELFSADVDDNNSDLDVYPWLQMMMLKYSIFRIKFYQDRVGLLQERVDLLQEGGAPAVGFPPSTPPVGRCRESPMCNSYIWMLGESKLRGHQYKGHDRKVLI